MSWVPSADAAGNDDDALVGEGGRAPGGTKRRDGKRKGVESFGAGMERGGIGEELTESERKGRTQRRKGIRSGSKNTFRRT